jgi:hypothetical protein
MCLSAARGAACMDVVVAELHSNAADFPVIGFLTLASSQTVQEHSNCVQIAAGAKVCSNFPLNCRFAFGTAFRDTLSKKPYAALRRRRTRP